MNDEPNDYELTFEESSRTLAVGFLILAGTAVFAYIVGNFINFIISL